MRFFFGCVLILGIGLAITLDYLHDHKAKILIVRNGGPAAITYGIVISDPPTSEVSEDRVARPGRLSWMIIFSSVEGRLRIRCRENANEIQLLPKPESRAPMLVTFLALKGCTRVTRQEGFAF